MQQFSKKIQRNSYSPEKHKILSFSQKERALLSIQSICLQIKSLIKIVNQQSFLKYYFKFAKTSPSQVIKNFEIIIQKFNGFIKIINKQQVHYSILEQILEIIENFLFMKILNSVSLIDLAIWLLEFENKFLTAMEFLSHGNLFQYIYNIRQQCSKTIYGEIIEDFTGDYQKIIKQQQLMKKILIVTTSAVIQQEQIINSFFKKFMFGYSYSKFALNFREATLKSFIFYRNPQLWLAQKIWNLPESGFTKNFVKLTYQNIKINKMLWIPIENIQSYQKPNIFIKDKLKSIGVRLLYNENLNFNDHKYHSYNSIASCCTIQQQEQLIQTIMIHMHGGGFVALSSQSMQIYTRIWSKKLKIPIFSIDYRLPPQQRFPSAPFDCFNVYSFICKHIHQYMNIKPKNIIVTGDSAGGNLACSLTALVLKDKTLPIPKSLFLAYPSTDCRKSFSPSKVNSFNDPLLPPYMLLLCMRQYLGQDPNNQHNPLASPLLLTQQYVNGKIGDKRFPLNWPKTSIIVGQKDPLFDDSIRLIDKLKQSKIPYKCRIYKNFSHGFLNLGFILPDANKIIKHSVIQLKNIMNQFKKQDQNFEIKTEILFKDMNLQNKDINIETSKDKFLAKTLKVIAI